MPCPIAPSSGKLRVAFPSRARGIRKSSGAPLPPPSLLLDREGPPREPFTLTSPAKTAFSLPKSSSLAPRARDVAIGAHRARAAHGFFWGRLQKGSGLPLAGSAQNSLSPKLRGRSPASSGPPSSARVEGAEGAKRLDRSCPGARRSAAASSVRSDGPAQPGPGPPVGLG